MTPDGLNVGEEILMFAVAILALAAIGISLWVAYGVARVRDQMDDFIDRNTPSFAKEHGKESEDTDEIPRIPPATEPNGMPLSVESAKLEAERGGTEYREFTRPDGTTTKFQFRSST